MYTLRGELHTAKRNLVSCTHLNIGQLLISALKFIESTYVTFVTGQVARKSYERSSYEETSKRADQLIIRGHKVEKNASGRRIGAQAYFR